MQARRTYRLVATGCLLLGLVAALLAQQGGSSQQGSPPDDASARFYAAIRANNIDELRGLLDQGLSPDTPDARGITPLMFAAAMGSADAMRLLLDRGADPNARNAFGSTALLWSATDRRKVQLLLDAGADPNLAANNGRTPLIQAAFANPGARIVRMLLDAGAEAGAADGRHVTPLNAASFGNDTESIRLLLAAGADIEAADSFIGLTPLMNAAGNRNPDAVRLLLDAGANVNAVSKTENLPRVQTGVVEFGGFTPLAMAAPFGPPVVVRMLLGAGAKVNVADVRGFTPLMLAVATDRQNPLTVSMLLAAGADPKASTRNTPATQAEVSAAEWAQRIGVPDVIAMLGGTPVTQTETQEGRGGEFTSAERADAVSRAVHLLEETSGTFFQQAGCFACHEQFPASFAASVARSRGMPIDEDAARERWLQMTATLSGPTLMEGAAALGGADNNLYLADALVRSGYPADRTTDFLAANVAMQQGGDGGWHLPGYSRSPIQDSDFSRTAMAIRILKTYGTPGRREEMAQRIARARQWLLATPPVILEDLNMKLAGAFAAGSPPGELQRLAQPILDRQRFDGGWQQRPALPSDAYATGMTLWTLVDAGVIHPGGDVYQRGLTFLLRTQAEDGSWHVASRATKFQPYFESGFPYGRDQWISTMATGWAAAAIAVSLPESAELAASPLAEN